MLRRLNRHEPERSHENTKVTKWNTVGPDVSFLSVSCLRGFLAEGGASFHPASRLPVSGFGFDEPIVGA